MIVVFLAIGESNLGTNEFSYSKFNNDGVNLWHKKVNYVGDPNGIYTMSTINRVTDSSYSLSFGDDIG
ncbi:MAG: hypothetical protein HRT57_12290 [Crocinitomicaceae bacterium]|nr:hypothetical protein [Crocinitomicaceae bacterium]